MDNATIDSCSEMSFADAPFPEVVARLHAAGVNSYRADLIRLRKAYYDRDSATYDGPLPVNAAPPVADQFVEEQVVGAVRAVQRQEIGYAEFLRRIMAAGCASYCVFLNGRKAIYVGRDGGFYVEPFPAPGS